MMAKIFYRWEQVKAEAVLNCFWAAYEQWRLTAVARARVMSARMPQLVVMAACHLGLTPQAARRTEECTLRHLLAGHVISLLAKSPLEPYMRRGRLGRRYRKMVAYLKERGHKAAEARGEDSLRVIAVQVGDWMIRRGQGHMHQVEVGPIGL